MIRKKWNRNGLRQRQRDRDGKKIWKIAMDMQTYRRRTKTAAEIYRRIGEEVTEDTGRYIDGLERKSQRKTGRCERICYNSVEGGGMEDVGTTDIVWE